MPVARRSSQDPMGRHAATGVFRFSPLRFAAVCNEPVSTGPFQLACFTAS